MTDHLPANFRSLHEQQDWLRVTLSSIGDAVITTDPEGRVTFLNPVAESLTGWTQKEALQQPLDAVIGLLNEESRQPVEIPTVEALREGRTAVMASHSLLVAKDGTERPISDSAALIRNEQGEVGGVVLVFRDITERRKSERALAKALAYADDIITTLREPFVVLDGDLRVKTANRAFYGSFHVSREETENRFVYELGNGQWDIPGLRSLLGNILSQNVSVQDFEIDHSFPVLGRKTMLLNARPFPPDSKHPELILLAIEDITDRKHAEHQSEVMSFAHGREHERKVVAHRLHDHLQQLLIAAKMRVGMANRREQDHEMQSALAQTENILQEAIDASRDLAVELNPPALFEAGLVPALKWLADWMRRTHEFQLDVEADPAIIIPYSQACALLFETVRELLLNALKHAGVGRANVKIERLDGDTIRVMVRDEGAGFVPKQLAPSAGTGDGFGLASIRHQIESLDGSFEIESAPGKGTSVSITLPTLR